jgi:hypothetical protein
MARCLSNYYLVFWQALKELEYPEKLQRLLLTPEREVLVELVITKDNGGYAEGLITSSLALYCPLLCFGILPTWNTEVAKVGLNAASSFSYELV